MEKTPEQIATEKLQALEARKAARLAASAERKTKLEAEKAERKAERIARAQAKAELKAAKVAAKAKKHADKDAAKAARKAAREAKKQPSQNGITRRGPGTKTGRVWEICDSISAELRQPTPAANVMKQAAAEGLHPTTTRCQYAAWKKFHGLKGRVTIAK